MKDSLNFLFVFLVSLYASLPAQAQSTCTNQVPSVVSNPDFSVYNNPQLGSRPLSDVCAWENAFGTAWHNSPVGSLPACIVLQTTSTVISDKTSGFYQQVSVPKNAELIIDIMIHHISGSTGDLQGQIDNLVVCLTNEDPTTLVQSNQMVEFDKLVLLELNNINISQSQRFTLDQPIVADKNYSKLLVYHSCNANSGSTSINIAKIEVLNTTYSNCYWPQYTSRSSNNEFKGHSQYTLLSDDEMLVYEAQETNCQKITLPDGSIIENSGVTINCYNTDGTYNWSLSMDGHRTLKLLNLNNGNLGIIYYANGNGGVNINGVSYSGINPGSMLLIQANNAGEITEISELGIPSNNLRICESCHQISNNKIYYMVRNTLSNNPFANILLPQPYFYMIEFDYVLNIVTRFIPIIPSADHNTNTFGISFKENNWLAYISSKIFSINLNNNQAILVNDIQESICSLGFSTQNDILVQTENFSHVLDVDNITGIPTYTFPALYPDWFNGCFRIINNKMYYAASLGLYESGLVRHDPYTGYETIIYQPNYELSPAYSFSINGDESVAYISTFQYACRTANSASNMFEDSSKVFKIDLSTMDTTCPDRSEVRAMYLYNNEGTSNGFMGNSNETLIANLEMAGVNTVILAVKTNLQNMGTTALAEYLSKIKNFNTLAHQKGWQVHAHPTYSFCDYENYLTEVKPFLLYFKNTFQGSAGISDNEKFDGFHTDFEPFAESCNNGWDNSDGFLFENTYIMPVYYSTIQNIRRELEDCYWPPTSQKGFRLSGTSFWKWPYYSNTMNSPVNALNASISTLTSDNYFDFVMPMNFRGTCQGWFYDWYYSPGYTPSPMDEGPMVMTIQADAQYSSCNDNALNSKTKVLQLQNQMQNLFINKENYLGSCIFDYSRFMAIPQEDQQSNDDVSEDIESISDASPDRTIEEQSTGKPDDLVSVYPNPFIDFIKINNRTGRETTARIYNSTMDLVEESSLLQINTSAYLPGMYFLNIINYKGEIILRTILIKK